MNRREVIRKFLTGGTVLVLVPSAIESCIKNPPSDMNPSSTTVTIDLTSTPALNLSGGSTITNNILVINVDNNFIALSSICTHQGCSVRYNAIANDIECPCHGSIYSIGGTVVVGPAVSPLHSFPISKNGTILTINL